MGSVEEFWCLSENTVDVKWQLFQSTLNVFLLKKKDILIMDSFYEEYIFVAEIIV